MKGLTSLWLNQVCLFYFYDLFDLISCNSTGMPYLDVIQRLRTVSNHPIAAYHVSGEYAMLKAAAQKVFKILSYFLILNSCC
jgi:hypothetical protein